MFQILRVIKPEMLQICRFYGGHRNLHSHYETLRVPPDASQKDIRHAFIKLSKEMHPDLSKKTNHADFVKVTEAYRVLSRPYTRQQHDNELQCNRAANKGRPVRVVFYQGPREWDPRRTPVPQDPNIYGDNYYGIKGIKRTSNFTIALLCILVSSFSLSLLILAISQSIAMRKNMLVESEKVQEAYRKMRSEVEGIDENEQIVTFEQRLRITNDDTNAKVRS